MNKIETINRVLKEYDSKNRLDNSFLKVKIKINEIVQQQPPFQPLYKRISSPTKEINDNIKGTTAAQSSSSSSSSPLTIINQKIKGDEEHQSNNNANLVDSFRSNSIVSSNNEPKTLISHSRNSSKSSALSFENKGHQRLVYCLLCMCVCVCESCRRGVG